MTILSQTVRRTPSTLKRATFAAVLMGGLLLTACGGTTPVVDPIPVTISSVTVTPIGTSLAVGATQQLKADVMGSGTYSTAVTWKSSDGSVLTVDANGLVTAKAAGTATVTATSTADASKSGSVTVKVAAVVPPFATVKVSFRPQLQDATTTPLPAGYTADFGAAYTAAKASGWITEASAGTPTAVPVDLTPNTRDRKVTTVSPEQNTFIHMQYTAAGIGNKTFGAWEYNVPNGSYNVTVSVGDAGATFPDTTPPNSTHTINVEGQPAIIAFVPPNNTTLFKTATVTVNVTDGKLTVDAKGGTNTKLNYVTIAAVTAAPKY